MSHYTCIRTQIREVPFLVEALHEMGFADVEVHEEAQHLFGYRGDLRPQTAEVIIRRKYIGAAANDVGFKRQDSGEFEAIISEFDRRNRCNTAWLQELNQRYGYHLVKEQMRLEDRVLESEEVLENGDIILLYSERG
ncbi:MAG TPA: DUF1257 domain-containing protein [Candidatus Hydrogenedentes bacterium]|nr:DUF1257 domain-containing protein [Candidatus Hydrogenedentota bacterium]HNT87910.1 DUF1257 domain-containing protein [Candidatus Hydrogenedentota bacterium]